MSSIILILLYIAYKFTMAGERQFAFNRAMVFSIYAMSLLMPVVYPALKQIQWGVEKTAAVIDIDPIGFAAYPVVNIIDETPSWIQIVLWIYLAGMVVATLRLAVSIIRIMILSKSKSNQKLDDGYTLIITDDRLFSPFSFMRYIVISREDFERSEKEILIHEMTHLRKHHWIDQMIGNFMAIFLWYNPTAWLMIEELKSIHEYQADAAVIASGADIRKYQYLLIEKAVGKRFPSPANSLNHSKLKKRVTMMYKSKPSPMRRLAGIAVIPAAIVALAITDIPAVAEVISDTENAKLRSVSDNKVNNFSADVQTVTNDEVREEPIKVVALGAVKKEENPEPEETIMVQKLDEMQVVAYANPNAKPSDKTFRLNGRDDVNYYINGVETPASAVEKIAPETIERIDVEKTDKSNPGKSAVKITLKDQKSPSAKTSSSSNENVYVAVDKTPEYPGGMDAMMKYLASNIRYPEEAQKKDIQGRVIVKFIVTEDGSVVDPSIVRGVDQSLDQEAIRVVKAMPKWTPGTVNGKPVSCYFTLPVNFRLQVEPVKTDAQKAE
ncbi:MAG: M56 family metallopeptidase [Muribaculaceae bacterium]|nr:M56 family metallopeptidase [Muribaculaceae bacterium]